MNSSFKKKSKRVLVSPPTPFTVDDFYSALTREKIDKAIFFQEELLPFVKETFKEFKIAHKSITTPNTDYWYKSYMPEENPTKNFEKNKGVWFTFAFSQTEKDPINIGTWLHSLGFQILLDVETQTTQRFFINKIMAGKTRFDEILKGFTDLVFRTYLKFEYQPIHFHWIPTEHRLTKEIDSSFIVENYHRHEESFEQERNFWVHYILENNTALSSRQATHLQRQNKRLNLAQILSFSIEPTDPLWNQNYATQLERFKTSISRLKPFVEFFVK